MIRWILVLMLAVLSSHRAFACGKQGLCDPDRGIRNRNEPLSINGEWQFYWKQLLTPDQIAQGQGRITGFIPLELDWLEARIPGETLHAGAYATYHMTLPISEAGPRTLSFPVLPSAAVLWVNGERIASFGELSTGGREKTSRQRLYFHTFVPKIGLNTITIEVSNFSYHFHNATSGVAIGRPEVIASQYQSIILRDSLTFGAILIMAFYHFYLWLLRRSRRAPLYFGIFCLAVGLRTLVAGDGHLLSFVFPEAPLELQTKIEYLGIALPFCSLILLVFDLYPREFPRVLALPLAGVAAIWAVIICVTNANIFPQLLRLYQFLILVAGAVDIGVLIFAAFRKREGAGIFLTGFGIFFAASVTDILTNLEIIRFPPIAHIGTFTMVFFQSILLSRRFDHAFDQAERAEKEVRSLNEGLEIKVKERTEQINIILQNVSSGFLLVDREGILQPGFTDSCHQLMGTTLVSGQPLMNLLPIDPKTKSMLRQTVVQVFEDFMPAEVSLSQIPYPVAVGNRMLGISGAGLRNEQGQVWAILFTINDVTRLQEAEQAIRYNEMLIGIIREKASFKVFLEDFRKEIQLSFTALQSGNERALRNLLHTMKGNLGAFGMHQLADWIHKVEGRDTIQREHIAELSRMMEDLLQNNRDLLLLDKGESTFEMRRSDYERIVAWGAKHLDTKHHQALLSLLKQGRQNPIRSYIGPLTQLVDQLAERLQKEVALVIEGADIQVDERHGTVLRNLIHLVRNSIDHGIERKGRIQLVFAQTDKSLKIQVEDDGRGLNGEEIARKARAMGLLQGSEHDLSEDELYRLIFAHGFSTAGEVSDISGRGVGMSAILDAVEQLQGTLTIASRSGQGLRVNIELPIPGDEPAARALDFAI